MIKANKEDEVVLKKVLYIHYLLQFRKNKKNKMQALINLNSKINIITPIYIVKLGLKIRRTNIGAQKINGSIF